MRGANAGKCGDSLICVAIFHAPFRNQRTEIDPHPLRKFVRHLANGQRKKEGTQQTSCADQAVPRIPFLAAKIAWAPYKLPKAPTANNRAYRTASRQTSTREIAWALNCA